MPYTLSVIIVSWNVKEFLRRCLESLYRYTKDVSCQVYVVDNNSTDGSQDMVCKEFPQVHVIKNPENRGFAKANNQALEMCRGEYVLFLNPDTELIDNALKSLAEFMDVHPEASGIGCTLLNSDLTLQRSCRRFPSVFTDLMESLYLDELFPGSPFFNYYRMGGWDHDSLRKVVQPAGACLLIRRDVLKQVGFMDERFFMFFEEVDLCFRVKKGGGAIYFVPSIRIIHHGNKSTVQVGEDSTRYYYQSKLKFFEKHYGRLSLLFLFFNLFWRSLIAGVLLPFSYSLFKRPRGLKPDTLKSSLKTIWCVYFDPLRIISKLPGK